LGYFAFNQEKGKGMKRLAILLLAVFGMLVSRAQTGNEISISLSVMPPYSPYFSDYSDLLGQGIITLTNLTNQPQSIKVGGSITSDNGLAAFTSPDYQPASPIILGPFETKVMLANQENQEYLDQANVDVEGDDAVINQIYQTGILPEGNYEICLRAYDFISGIPLSPDAPSGCVFIPILYAQPPMLANPLCADSVMVTNNIMPFSWLPVVAPTMQPMLYDLYVVKLLSGMNPNDAINGAIHFGAGNPIIKTNLITTNAITLPADLPLEENNWYAWCVVAHDPSAQVWIENNGRSEVCTFFVRGPEIPTTLTTYMGTPDLPPLMLVPIASVSGNIKYKFHGDGGGSLITSSSANPVTNFNNWFANTGGGSTSGATGTTYTAINPDQIGNVLGSFDLFTNMSTQPPMYLLPSGYNTAGGLPLKNTGVVFTARYAVGKSMAVASVDDLEIINPNGGSPVYFKVGNGPLTHAGPSWETLGSAMTSANGDFFASLMMTQPFGLLQTGQVTARCGGGEFIDEYSGYGLYRVVTMEVVDARYCHPDVIFFPQPGQQIDLPQQMVKVKSYNLQVLVKSNNAPAQQAGQNNPIDGVVVRIGRVAQEFNNFPPNYPQGEIKMANYGYSMSNAIPDVYLCDSVKTNGQGIAGFTRLVRSTGMCNETGSDGMYAYANPTDGYYIEAFTDPFDGNYNYNKKRIYNFSPCADGMGIYYSQHGVRSRNYLPPMETVTLVLTPKDPEIYVSVQANYGLAGEPLPNTNLLFEIKKPNSPITWQVLQTDANGFLKKQIGPADYFGGFAWKSMSGIFMAEYKVTPIKPGYRMQSCLACYTSTGDYIRPKMGERWTVEAMMEPKGNVRGIVRDEDGDPIQGEVKIGAGVFMPLETMLMYVSDSNPPPPTNTSGNITVNQLSGGSFNLSGSATNLFGSNTSPLPDLNGSLNITNTGIFDNIINNTSTSGNVSGLDPSVQITAESVFDLPAQSGSNVMIIVRPYDTSLFTDTFYVNIPTNYTEVPTNLGIFIVKKKLHRPVFTVVSGAATAMPVPLPGSAITLSDFAPVNTNTQGKASFLFPSPAHEFRVQVQKNGFALYDEHLVIPVTREPFPITIQLQPGVSVSGTVTSASTNQPIANARVHCVIGANEYGDIVVETTTNASGQYTLSNLPTGMRTIHAHYADDNITYVGKKTTLSLPTSNPVNFSLSPAPFHLPSVWGFPADVSSFTTSGAGWLVTGALRDVQGNARFEMEKDDQRLNFSGLPVIGSGQSNAAGQPIATPSVDQFDVAEMQVRAVLNDQHIMSLSGIGGTGFQFMYHPALPPMTLSKIRVARNTSTNTGELRCKAFMLLEAFRMEYQYNGQFFLGESANSTTIAAFKGTASAVMPEQYYLMNLSPLTNQIQNPEFTVHEFDAFADRSDSYLRGDSLVLGTRLRIDLPNSNPEELIVDAGRIVILPNEIQIFPGDEGLEFNLETWKVTTNSWTFDPAYGGIVTSGSIETNSIDFQAPLIILRPNEMILPNAQSINTQELSISGVTPFKINPGTSLSFGYFNAPMHDPNNGHWRISLFNPNGHVGFIEGMPGWNSGVKLNFQFMENFSDGFIDFRLAPNQFINHYNVMNQNVTNLTKTSNGFTLYGPLDLDIPNLSDGYTINMVYYREGNTVRVRPNGLFTGFETMGQVHFMGDQQVERITLDWNLLKVPGLLTIYDDQSSNVIALRTMLQKTPQQIRLDIMTVDGSGIMPGPNVQVVSLGGGSSGKQRILEGTQLVVNNQWAKLGYLAQFTGYTGSMGEGSDKMWFTVSGAITNDTSKPEQIELTNIETPFGDFSLTYIFEDMEIRGAVSFGTIPFGTVVINNGSAQLGFGGKGFFFVAEMNATYPMIGALQTNLITGWYPEITPEAAAKLKQGMYLKKLPNWMNGGIHGLYICANKTLIQIDEEIDFGLFGGGLYINTGMDLRFWVNFSGDYGGAHFGALAYCDTEVYAHALGICTLCFGFLAELSVGANFQWEPESSFSGYACGSLSLNVEMCGVGWTESAKVEGTLSSAHGAELSVTFGETCSDNITPPEGDCRHF
jgi:hypothetical protein